MEKKEEKKKAAPKKEAQEPEKKARWTSIQRLAKKQGKEKPEKLRWRLRFKKIKEQKEAHRKLRQKRKKNRQMLIDKGVIKV
jgi:hypothetical protein